MNKKIYSTILLFLIFNSTNMAFSQTKYYCPDVDRAYMQQFDNMSSQGYNLQKKMENSKNYISSKKTSIFIDNITTINSDVTKFHARASTSYIDLGNHCMNDVLSRICTGGYLKPDGINVDVQCNGFRGSATGENNYGGNITKDKNGVYTNKY